MFFNFQKRFLRFQWGYWRQRVACEIDESLVDACISISITNIVLHATILPFCHESLAKSVDLAKLHPRIRLKLCRWLIYTLSRAPNNLFLGKMNSGLKCNHGRLAWAIPKLRKMWTNGSPTLSTEPHTVIGRWNPTIYTILSSFPSSNASFDHFQALPMAILGKICQPNCVACK